MYYFRKLKVKKDPRTHIYVYHIDDDHMFHDLDRQGLLYNKMRVRLHGKDELTVECWMDEKRFSLYQEYIQTPKYREFVELNKQTRFDIEPIITREDLGEPDTNLYCSFTTQKSMIDEQVHTIANILFRLNPELLPNRENLIFVTEQGKDGFWRHSIHIDEKQKFLLQSRTEFIYRCREYFHSVPLEVEIYHHN